MGYPLNISSIQIFQYRLPFSQPFVIARQELNFREGLIIQLKTDEGRIGLGEIAPLPGLSSELLKESVYQARGLRSQMGGLSIPKDAAELKGFFSAGLFNIAVPSVRFGFEMAVAHAAAQTKNCTVAEFLGCRQAEDLPTAGLLQGTVDEVKSRAQVLMGQGYRVFKLKVGSKNIPLDVKKVEAVQSVIGPAVLLRLDANRGWGLNEALAFEKNIDPNGIEFIEEPLNDVNDLQRLSQETPVPIALDESLFRFDPQRLTFFEHVKFLVLKPMVLGGIVKTLDWIAQAQSQGKSVVISSAFESAAGRLMLANLAMLTERAAGLGTGDWFKEDLMLRPLAGPDGVILKKSLQFGVEDIKPQQLTEISY